MKPVIFYTVALDEQNQEYADKMIRSFKYYNDYPLKTFTIEDFTDLLGHKPEYNDFYRLTPMFARSLIDEYELVVRLDADQVILGKLDYIVDHRKDYDLGTVLNINRIDPLRYEMPKGYGIEANEYYNMGLLAFTNKKLLEHLWKLCHSKYYYRLRFREQDIMNILAHYGDYKVRCFDHYDYKNKYYAWHGLVAKGEGSKMILDGDTVILPKGKDNYPDHDLVIKAYHWAGGDGEVKWNLHNHFNEELAKHILKITA